MLGREKFYGTTEIIFSCSKHWHTDKFKVHLSWSSFPDKERRKSLSDEIKAILSGTRMIFVITFNLIIGKESRLFVCFFFLIYALVGKKGLLNGEVTESSPETSGSASQNSDQDRKMANAYDNLKAKAFDINDFFIGDSLLPLSGVVSFFLCLADQLGLIFNYF